MGHVRDLFWQNPSRTALIHLGHACLSSRVLPNVIASNVVQIENPLNEWSWAYPTLESIHLLGIVCALGAVALMNFRLLGLVTHSTPSRMWRDTLPLTLIGLTIAITSGLLLFTIAQEYFERGVFRLKMLALVVAIIFYFTAVRSAAARDRTASVVAVISLVLYALIPLGGILLGYD